MSDKSGSFYEFQKLCKEIENLGGQKDKSKAIKSFLQNFDGDTYLLFKFLMPAKMGLKFGLKDRKLVNLFSTILSADKEEMLDHMNEGDVSETLKKFYKESGTSVNRSRATLQQIDDLLEQIASSSKDDEYIKIFEKHVVGKMTGDDLKWLVRLITMDLKIGAGPKVVLDALHPNAYQAYKLRNDLKSVVEQVESGNLQIDDESDDEPKKKGKGKVKNKLSVVLQLHTPVKPMLARASKSFEDALQRCPNGFFIETKYDGERIQVHKDGDEFKFWSRNLKPVTEYKIKNLKKYINEAVKAKRVILDGEILCVNTKTGKPLPFGSLGKSKRHEYENAQEAIYFFDILYLEGKTLLDYPIRKRRKVLEKVVKEIPNRILFSEYEIADGPEDQREALLSSHMSAAIQEGLEGLVLKDLESVYEPAARRWLKMKKDYLKGMADTVDLIVLGAYYGTGSKGGLMSVFLMGVYDEDEKVYKTVCKAGNGHDDSTISKLNEELKPIMKKIRKDPDLIPDWLQCDRTLVPDFVVCDPKKSVVWEISGAEFSKSPVHTANKISIRFPRVTRIRDDKSPEDATTLRELIKLQKASLKKAPVQLKDLIKKTGNKKNSSKSNSDDSEDEEDAASTSKSRNQKRKREEIEEELEGNEEAEFGYIYGDLTSSKGTGNIVLVHSVDDSGRWSNRGTMGAITNKFGDGPEKKYEQSIKDGENDDVGDIQIVRVSGSGDNVIWVCNLIGQVSKKGSAPPIEYGGLERGLQKVAKFAKKEKASVHFAKFHHSVPNLDWPRVEKLLIKCLVHNGIDTTVYSRDPNDKSRSGKRERIRGFNQTKKRKIEESDEEVPTKNKTKKTKDYDPLNLHLLDGDSDVEMEEESRETKGDRSEDKDPFDSDTDIEMNDEEEVNVKSASKESINPLEDVNAVIAGYSPEEKEEIAKLIKELGGKVQEKWTNVGAKSTHLICETFTDMYEHVSKLGGTIVTRKWVDDAKQFGKKMNEDKYTFPNPMEEDDEVKETSESPSQSKAITKYLQTIDKKSKPKKRSSPLLDIFTGCRLYLYKALKESQIKRYFIAFDGDVMSEFDKDTITHIVTDAEWDDNLSQFKRKAPKVKIIRSTWVWDCVNNKKLLSEKDHAVDVK